MSKSEYKSGSRCVVLSGSVSDATVEAQSQRLIKVCCCYSGPHKVEKSLITPSNRGQVRASKPQDYAGGGRPRPERQVIVLIANALDQTYARFRMYTKVRCQAECGRCAVGWSS